MTKNSFYYLIILIVLFFVFFYVLDQHKAQASYLSKKLSYDVLKCQWMVAEVKAIHSARDLTPAYKATEFQFLSSGGFVEMDKSQVHKTGSWQLADHQLEIRYDHAKTAVTYKTELVSNEELLLLNDSLQFRLLRLKL